MLVAVQLLDGVSAAMLGVMVPLIVADITRGTGRFNLAQGIVGTAVGIGASLSPTLAGYSATTSAAVAFLGLAAIAACGLALVWALMPETRPASQTPTGDAELQCIATRLRCAPSVVGARRAAAAARVSISSR